MRQLNEATICIGGGFEIFGYVGICGYPQQSVKYLIRSHIFRHCFLKLKLYSPEVHCKKAVDRNHLRLHMKIEVEIHNHFVLRLVADMKTPRAICLPN